MEYDPFGQNEFADLDNLTSILTNIVSVLDIVKIVMEQKGFKGTGLNVNVDVVPRQVNLIM
jgi:hypothetical protein